MENIQALHYVAPLQLEWRAVPKPQLEDATDALVKPIAVAACDLDPEIAKGNVPFPGPFVMGHEFVGEIVETGSAVTDLRIGEVVLASFQPSCGYCLPCGRGLTASCVSVHPTSMYGVGSISGDWSGAFSELLRVPFADFNLLPLPKGVTPVQAASASDNLADAYRAVVPFLDKFDGQSVLVAGTGSIALYTVLWARAFGASHITFVAPASIALKVAARLGAEAIEVSEWPDRFDKHEITVNCASDATALESVINSTTPQGDCINCAIPFQGEGRFPLFKLYMSGIHFHTGRVNSAASMDKVIDAIARGVVDPDDIEPRIVDFEALGDVLPHFDGTKLIAMPQDRIDDRG